MSSSWRHCNISPSYTHRLLESHSKPPMFTLLLSSVVIAGGTYFLYQYLFSENDEEENYSLQPDNNTNIEEEEEDNGGCKLRIFFGSQSGTAEGFAFDMEKEARKFGFSAKAIDLEDYDPEDLCDETLVIFLVATYGEGEPTDNSQEFYNWLSSESDRTDSELSNIEYAVFGLGNSQYEFFNSMGKQFDKYLGQYGGTRIYVCGEGDDDIGSIEDQFNDWKEELYKLLCAKYLGIDDMTSMDNKFECSLQVNILDEENSNYNIAKRVKMPYNLTNYIGTDSNGERIDKSLFLPSRHKPYFDRIGICQMVSKSELRQNNNDGSTLHISFDLTFNPQYNKHNGVISYHTADNMGFIPRNDYKIVDKLCKRLEFNKHEIIEILPKDKNINANYTFPQIVSIENLLLWFLDINISPNKKLLTILCNTFMDENDGQEDEKKEMMQLCENIQENIINKHITIVDIFLKYKTIKIDLNSLIELLKPLQPRLYTIASSASLDPNQVSICIKLEQENEIINEENKENIKEFEFNGVQSNYFIQSKVSNIFQFYIEESKFKLPAHHIPIIMISVGAGLAPFAAFIDEGDGCIKSENQISKSDYGEWWMFFGCRYKIGDYIYKQKLEESYNDKNGVIEQLKVAFSREQKKKIYVQHLIEENQEELWQLIDKKKARIYVCGGVAMGKAVRETFQKIFTFYCKTKNGHEYLDNMLKKDIYVQELWG